MDESSVWSVSYTHLLKAVEIEEWTGFLEQIAEQSIYEVLILDIDEGIRGVYAVSYTHLAPTWIHVADTNGNISSIASADYVSYAHKQNVEVWMTVRDFDGGISSEKESYELLSYTSRRETLITQLIAEALRVGVDGINVDFEKISDKCGEHYIEFIRELSVKCRQNGLVLSVDNYVPKSFNTQYDRKEQGIVADYVVIMGYDEYYAGSPEAGPVSCLLYTSMSASRFRLR